MKCPFCGSQDSKVVDKRETESDKVTRRRRECLKCTKRYTTYERLENMSIMIIKKDGVREQYDRDKILKGIIRSCEKLTIAREAIDATLDEIEAEIKASEQTEIPAKKVGSIVMKKLKKLDKVAYIRFASVYKEFKDVEDFNKELEKFSKK